MRKVFRLVSLGLMVTATCASALAQEDSPQVAAVPAVTIGADTYIYTYWGTGFFVDRQGHVLTAYHLISDCTKVDIVGSGESETATVVASNPEADLSLLHISRSFGAPAAFASGDHLPGGAMVTILGYAPLGDALRAQGPAQQADFNSMVLKEDPPEHIALVSDANPGASGSPVVTRDGLVAGVLQSKLIRSRMLVSDDEPSEVRLALNGAVAESFLRQNGVAPLEASDERRAKLNRLGELAAAEVKVVCHR